MLISIFKVPRNSGAKRQRSLPPQKEFYCNSADIPRVESRVDVSWKGRVGTEEEKEIVLAKEVPAQIWE